MSTDHQDPAATIQRKTADELLVRATPRGRRLLELFARQQLLRFDDLREEFGLSQNGLNALMGRLTQEFQKIQGDPGFHIYLPKVRGWAIGHTSGRNLRHAVRRDEESRQQPLPLPGPD